MKSMAPTPPRRSRICSDSGVIVTFKDYSFLISNDHSACLRTLRQSSRTVALIVPHTPSSPLMTGLIVNGPASDGTMNVSA